MENNYQQIIVNINKLLSFMHISISQLSTVTGLSVSGIKHMFDSGKFRLENLMKIADALNVPTFILMADELDPERKTSGEHESVTINYQFNETSKFKVLNDGKKLTTMFLMKGNSFGVDESKYQDMEERVQNLELELERKNERIETLKELNQVYKESAETYKQYNENIMKRLFDDTGQGEK